MSDRQRRPRLQLALFLALATSWAALAPALAWNDFGHMTVAYIAYKKLDDKTRSRVDELLKLNPSYRDWQEQMPSGLSEEKRRAAIFMYASTWPDTIKGDHSYHADGSQHGFRPEGTAAAQNIGYSDHQLHKYWHFVDQPFTYDHTRLPEDIEPNALTQLATFRRTLASDQDDALKSFDLTWILHIVGDLHQPLHCVTRVSRDHRGGDSGGNDVLISNAGESKNLHGLWDWILGKGGPREVMAFADQLPEAPTKSGQDTDARDWAREGFKLARKNIYSGPIKKGSGPFAITDDYLAASKTLAAKRAELGGARLATLLNQELK